MREIIEFKVGYYEWNVFVNGKYFYTFNSDSVSESVPFDANLADLENIVEDYINYMQLDLGIKNDEDENIKPLKNSSIPMLKKLMVNMWAIHFGITI